MHDVLSLSRRVAELEQEVARFRAEAQFRAVRAEWPGLGGWPPGYGVVEMALRCMPPAANRASGRTPCGGQGLVSEQSGARSFSEKKQDTARGWQLHAERVEIGQVASKRVQTLLRYSGSRPVWDASLFAEFARMRSAGDSVDPLHYPHASGDIRKALRSFALKRPAPSVPPARPLEVAVWSALSPWVELTVLSEAALDHITTVDYQPPIVQGEPRIRSLHVAELPELYGNASGAGAFDVVVAFSGLEHDGLGRYGEPLNPNGDLAALREIRLLLLPRGLLLLGVPTAKNDDVVFPYHRLYGRHRLERILATGYELVGRVWDGRVVTGGLERAEDPPKLFPSIRLSSSQQHNLSRSIRRGERPSIINDWQHQPVLVLVRNQLERGTSLQR